MGGRGGPTQAEQKDGFKNMGQLPASFQGLKTDAGQCGQNWILVLMAPRGAFCPPSTLSFLVRGDKFPFFNWSSHRLSEAFRFFSSSPACVLVQLKVRRMVELVGMLLKDVNTQSQLIVSTRWPSSRKSGAQTLKADVVEDVFVVSFMPSSVFSRCFQPACSPVFPDKSSHRGLASAANPKLIVVKNQKMENRGTCTRGCWRWCWRWRWRVFEQGASFIALLSSLSFVLAHILR